MDHVSYTDHAKLNLPVLEIKQLLADTSDLRRVALQYASKQLTRLLLGHRIRRRWALGPERTLRVLDYLTRVSFDDSVTTAEINFLRDCDARLSPRFYQRFIVTVEDLLGVVLHERNHPLLVGLVYPALAVSYDPNLPHNAIDDVLDNALVRSLCFTDLFERFYLGSPDGETPPAVGEYGEWVVPTHFNFARWYWPLLTYRNDLCVTTLNDLVRTLPVTDERQLKQLRDLAATHWGNYEPFRHRLTQHLALRSRADQKHPLFARLQGMLRESQRTTLPDGLTPADWAEWRVRASRYTPLEALRALRRGFAVITALAERQRHRSSNGEGPRPADDFLRPTPSSPLLGDTPANNGGLAKVSGVIEQRLPEWTDDDSNLVRLAREALDDLRDYAPNYHVDADYLAPFDRYQHVLLGVTAQHLNAPAFTSELLETHSQSYLPARLSRRDLVTLSLGDEPLDYHTRTAQGTPPPPYHLVADVSGSMTRYLPLLPAFIRATREQLANEALVFSGEQHLLNLDELLTVVRTNHQTLFLPVWEYVLAAGWQRLVVLTDDETAERHLRNKPAYLALRDAVRAQRVALCLLRVGSYCGTWTELLQADGQALGPPHLLVELSPTAAQTAAA